MFFGAKRSGRRALAKIPSKDSKIYQLCKSKAGFVPYYLRLVMIPGNVCCLKHMLHSNAKHALAYAFLMRLCEGSEEVPTRVKAMMCYICATNAGNNILRAHFAFMACRGGVPITRLIEITRRARNTVIDKSSSDNQESIAMALAHATSYDSKSVLAPELVYIISGRYSPAGVIELLTTVSLECALHRWTSVYVPMSYEPEVEGFLASGMNSFMLNLPLKGPALKSQEGWDELARKTRLSGLLLEFL
ncbi:unnamed protein product [Choristocarpus tenellus]